MFKGFANKSRQFNGFPNLNFQVNNEAYGFSGCTLWLDAAYGLNTQTDLAAVSSWQSKIGGITFTQATAGNQPRFILSDINFNNLPTVDFTPGTTRTLTSILSVPVQTIALITRYTIISQLNTILGTGVQQLFLAGTNAGANGSGYFSGTYASGTTESTTTKITIINSTNIYVNGVSEFSGTTSISTLSFTNISNTGTNASNAYLAEIIVFRNNLNATDCINLSNRLNSKYAIY